MSESEQYDETMKNQFRQWAAKLKGIEQFASMLKERHTSPYDPYSEAMQLINHRWLDHGDGERYRDEAYGEDWARDRSYTNGAAMVLADMVLHFTGVATYDEVPA
jgi:hypothetical protein